MQQRKTTVPTGNDLWDKYFRVRMLYLHSRSIEQIRRYGMRVSGVEEIDQHLDKQEIVTEANIDRMFEKWRAGVTVKVVNYSDTAEIYKIIHSHLIAWAEYLSQGVNIGNAPLKDLIELDQFAGVVYDKAKSVFSEELRKTAIDSNFLNVQSIHFKNILSRSVKEEVTHNAASGAEVTKVTKVDDNGIRERNSLKEIFSQQINQLSGWRQP